MSRLPRRRPSQFVCESLCRLLSHVATRTWSGQQAIRNPRERLVRGGNSNERRLAERRPQDPTTEESSSVHTEGNRQVRRTLPHYSLDAIISVAYRVNSQCAVRFRQWATRTLREHLVHGFTLNQRRLADRAQ